jgi:hypothetical protein
MNFTVTLSSSPARPVTVQYATQDASAVAIADFAATSGTLSFNPGETSMPIPVTILGDTAGENNEIFFVILSNPTGAALGKSQGTGTIQTDEPLGVAAFCNPRPNISVTTQAIGGRQLQVTVKADTAGVNASNVLTQIQFGVPDNSTLQVLGQSTVGTAPIALPPGTKQVVFLLAQTDFTKAFKVAFTISDSCSALPGSGPINKFVGAGKDGAAN